MKNLGYNHDSHVESDILLLPDIFESFYNKCIEIYKLDPGHLLLALRLAWQTSLKKREVELELLTGIDTLLIVGKGIRGGISHAIHGNATANNKCMRGYNKDNESSYNTYLDANNLYRWVLSQKLPADSFEWKKSTSKFNVNFIKNYDEDSDIGYILEVDIKYPKRLHNLHNDLPFLPERMKIKS